MNLKKKKLPEYNQSSVLDVPHVLSSLLNLSTKAYFVALDCTWTKVFDVESVFSLLNRPKNSEKTFILTTKLDAKQQTTIKTCY